MKKAHTKQVFCQELWDVIVKWFVGVRALQFCP